MNLGSEKALPKTQDCDFKSAGNESQALETLSQIRRRGFQITEPPNADRKTERERKEKETLGVASLRAFSGWTWAVTAVCWADLADLSHSHLHVGPTF